MRNGAPRLQHATALDGVLLRRLPDGMVRKAWILAVRPTSPRRSTRARKSRRYWRRHHSRLWSEAMADQSSTSGISGDHADHRLASAAADSASRPTAVLLPPGVADRFGVALAAAARTHAASMRELEEAVGACVAAFKTEGLPPERVLVRMHALVHASAEARPGEGSTPTADPADRFADEVIEWAITAYYSYYAIGRAQRPADG
jgi:hypothetical protein